MTKTLVNETVVNETRIENKPFIFNLEAMQAAAKATLAKPVATHARTSTAAGQSQLTQAIGACVCQAAVLGSTQLSMGQIKMMLSDGGFDISDKAVAKKISDYVWNVSERNTKSKSVALLTLVKDSAGQVLSGVYGINMSHPSVVNALSQVPQDVEAEAEVAE